MAVNAKNIVIGDKTFTERVRTAVQDQVVATRSSAKEAPLVEEEVIEKTTSSFILNSGSKFHRDMIE